MGFYASYDEGTASRLIRYRRDGRYSLMAVWDPPPAFTGERPVYLFKHGGKRHNPRDFIYGLPPALEMATDNLGAFVVAYDAAPGGLWRGEAEEADMEFWPECVEADALAPMFVRAMADDAYLVGGSGRTISRNPSQMVHAGESSGGRDALAAQLVPEGDFAELAAREGAHGGRLYRYDPDHRAGHVFAFQAQNRLSSFVETVTNDAGVGSYVAGTASAGASTLPVSGDTFDLRRGNRLEVRTSTSYTTTGSNLAGASTLNVTGSAMPIPQGVRFRYNDGVGDQEVLIEADYDGVSGTVALGGTLPNDVPPGTALVASFVYAVSADQAGGAVSVPVWPTLQTDIVAGATVLLEHPNQELYGENGWASGYLFSGASGWTWRTFPLDRKVDADLDRLAVAANPRARELNALIVTPGGETLQRVDSLTVERSFWLRRQAGGILPEHFGLHDEGDMAALAHALHLAGNANVHAWLGAKFANPSGTDASVPWLKGRYIQYSVTELETFLTDASRIGGPVVP